MHKEIKPGGKWFKRLYINILMFFVGRGLQAAARVDKDVKNEIAEMPEGFSFMLKVLPDSAKMIVAKDKNGRLKYHGNRMAEDEIDVIIMFKNIEAAMLLFTFRESTAVSFARDRMIVKGDLSNALAVVRCLNIVESYLLPAFIARLAVKRYPRWPFMTKLINRTRVYFRVLLGY